MYVSRCHKAEIHIHSSEGCEYYYCSTCGLPCDSISSINKVKEWLDDARGTAET